MYRIEASFTDKLLALIMVCSVWTSLRFASVIGLSEILILALGFIGRFNTESEDITPYHESQDMYFRVVAFIIPLGIAVNFITRHDTFQMVHDLFAFIFAAFLCSRVLNRAKLYLNLTGLLYWFFIFTSIMNVWYYRMHSAGVGFFYEDRFEGYATDPNQLAEALFLVPWLGLYFLRKLREEKPEKAVFYRIVCVFCIATSCYIGTLTDSDSFILSLAVGGLIYVFMEIRKIARYGDGNHIAVIIAVLGIGYVILHFNSVIGSLSNYFVERAEDTNQLVTRQNVWINGLRAFLNSPLFGNGPGAFSGNWGPFTRSEPHNTFIYVLMDFGIVGFALLINILIRCWNSVRLSLSSEFAAAFVAFLIFCFFHSFQRMPLFWIYTYLFTGIALCEKKQQYYGVSET